MNKKTNRYMILAAGMVLQFCAGIIYMWSVFKTPVSEHLNWDGNAAALTSSIMLMMFVLGIIAGGRAQDVLGPRKVTIAGSIMISLGMILTSFVPSSAPWLVYVTYSIIGGLGVGAVYTATVSIAQKWFPDKRGFASGMIVSAFGFSLVVFSPVAKSMLSSIGVPMTFLIFGIAFLVICLLFSIPIQNPDEKFLSQFAGNAKGKPAQKQYTTGEMLKTKQFYLLAFGLLFTLPAYFVINPILLDLGNQRELGEVVAVVGVMLTGVGSATGRLIVSWASDKIGRQTAMISIALIMMVFTLFMIFATGALFLICLFAISFCFGGAASVYSATTADHFGTKHGGLNFGCAMLGFGVSAILFPIISNAIVVDGNYTPSFIVCAAASLVTVVLVSMLKKPKVA